MGNFLLLLTLTDLSAVQLAADLGHESYSRRERAFAALRQMGPLVAHRLAALSLSDDLEVRYRACRLLAEQEDRLDAWLCSLVPPGFNRLPWIDGHPQFGLAGLDHYRIRACTEYGCGVVRHPPLTGWPEWRLATLYWLRDEYHRGTPAEELRRQLAAMAAAEERWLKGQQ